MTLLELVVVIAILAVLSTVALRSLTGVASQARFEATQRTLENIQDAILGSPNDHQPDGSRVISGFIADMGRLPQAMLATNSDGTTSLTLNELLLLPVGALPFDVRPATAANVSSGMADPNVLIPCGWRGPYLRLAVGENVIADGWGVALANSANNIICLYKPDLTPVANPGDLIGVVSSSGAVGVQGYNTNINLSVTNFQNLYAASLIVTVSVFDLTNNLITSFTNGDQVLISVFGPDPANIGKIAVQTNLLMLTSNPLSCLFTNSLAQPLTQGPRAVRAYFQSGSGGGTNNSYSAIKYLNLHPGFNNAGPLTLIRPY